MVGWCISEFDCDWGYHCSEGERVNCKVQFTYQLGFRRLVPLPTLSVLTAGGEDLARRELMSVCVYV